MEIRCENCEELIEPIESPNPQVNPEDPKTFDVLCPLCRFILATHDASGAGKVACVTIRGRNGGEFMTVTAGHSLFEAVANAIDFFADSYWHGPKPRKDTVYEVSSVGDDRTWKVHAASVERWTKKV